MIIERVHEMVDDMIHAHDLKDQNVDKIDPWGSILTNIIWAIRINYHTAIQASPDQLVFGRNMLFNIIYTPDWEIIQERKKIFINKINQAEIKTKWIMTKKSMTIYQFTETVYTVRLKALS